MSELRHLCRICCAKIEKGLPVFGEQGNRLHWPQKLRKYLHITVSSEDNLPKILCEDCCGRLEEFHKFAAMALRSQRKLKKQLDRSGSLTAPDLVENNGLLRSYLTKDTISSNCRMEVEDSEEVEVPIDPMQFLQYGSWDGEAGAHETRFSNSEADVKLCKRKQTTKRFPCSFCGKQFHAEISLRHHIWWHMQKRKKCYDRIKFGSLQNKEVVLDGLSKRVKSSGGFRCPICAKEASTKEHLRIHLEIHRPKGKYTCDICGRTFKTQRNLHRHKEYHEDIQFPCSVCGRVYPTNSTLRAHSITHSDLRPHKCLLCEKTFKRNQDLKFHVNQHTGARPYQCPYCPKAFASSGNCFSHRKRMHPKEVERDKEMAAKILQ